jgi:hypothetical protein
MISHVIQPNMMRLDPNNETKRVPTRPLELQEPDYIEKYDERTLFYDATELNGEIILIGPPLVNLENLIIESKITINGIGISDITTQTLERSQITRITPHAHPDSPIDIELSHPKLGSHHVRITPESTGYFISSKVLMTMQKNEDLQWIEDWARYYIKVHQVDSILIFDNNSTEYTPKAIQEQLKNIPGLESLIIVEWPFPYGPQGGQWVGTKAGWDSDFCQIGAFQTARYRFLNSAEAVINADIDELVVPLSEKRLFDELAQSEDGVVGYAGRWIENQPINLTVNELPRFWNYIYSKDEEANSTSKWTAKPSQWPTGAHPTAHYVRNIDYYPSPDFYTAHFKGINSGWKRADRLNVSSQVHELGYDAALLRALDRAFPQQALELRDHLDGPGNFPVKMTQYRFRSWLQSNLALTTPSKIPWNKIWLWKSAVPVFEVASPLGQLAFDLHLTDSYVRMAVVVRDANNLTRLTHAIESLSESLDETTSRSMGFWTTQCWYSSAPDSTWQFASIRIEEQMSRIWQAINSSNI